MATQSNSQGNAIVPSTQGAIASATPAVDRLVPTATQLESWIRGEIESLIMADSEFTAYTITLRLKDPQICGISSQFEINHTDTQILVHDVIMPEVMQRPDVDYVMEWRDWFNPRKGYSEPAKTYIPAKNMPQITASVITPVGVTQVQQPSLSSNAGTIGIVIDED